MPKKILYAVSMLVMIAATGMANATSWTLSCRVLTAGGSLQVRSESPLTSLSGTIQHTYTTSRNVPVTLTPLAGYQISAVTLNNSSQPLPVANPVSMGLLAFPNKTAQSMTVSFAKQLINVTSSSTANGTVTPAGTNSYASGTAVSYVFTPNPGVSLLSVSGAPSGTTFKDASTNATVTLPYFGAVRVAFNVPTSAVTLTGYFIGLTANAGAPQTALNGTLVTLAASSVVYDGAPSVSYAWTQTGGATVALTGALTATPSFTPHANGTYQFTVVATDSLGGTGSAATYVTVTDSAAAAAEGQCQGCHRPAGVGATANVFANWSSSVHETKLVMCARCHVGTDTGNHPGTLVAGTVSETTFTFTPGGASFCLNGSCHTPGITHKTVGMACANCHNSGEIHKPDASFSAALNVCFNCHGAVNTTHYYANTGIGTANCTACHNPQGHNPAPPASIPRAHFNGYTSYSNPNYAAAYVTPATLCSNCHKGGDATSAADKAIVQYRLDWAGSPHGDIKGTPYLNTASVNWKAAGMAGVKVNQAAAPNDCLRCHTSTGYVQFSNLSSIAPLATSAARYSEPITCNGCHNADFTLRSVTPRTGYYNYSSAKTGKLLVSAPFPDSRTSNICIGCHTGRQSGDTIKAIAVATAHKNYSSSFWQNINFVSSHWLTAGGQVFGITGYEYPGQNYSNAVNHSYVGSGVYGPCVTCHMPNNSHTKDPSIYGFVQCSPCHGTTITTTFVANKTADFNAALSALGAALTQKGFVPNVVGGVLTLPYFTATNWGNKDTGPATMGAAYNYNMLMHDPGAFAHNPTYTKRLVRDSLDYLTNGSIDRNRDLSATINTLLTSQTARDDAKQFLQNAGNGSAACSVCHSDSVDLAGNNILAAYNASLHASAPGGAACGSCHASGVQISHPSAAMLTSTAGVSGKCAGCHPLHPWTSAGICTTCHYGHNPKTVKMPYPHYASYSTAQYVTTNIACSNCHYVVAQPGATAAFSVFSANMQWGRSGKGNQNSPSYVSYDFKSLGSPFPASPANSAGKDCVRCHTTTGYQNFVNSNFTDIHAWGTSGLAPGGDRTREMVACSACHNPTPFNAFDSVETDEWGDTLQPAFSRRAVPQVTAYYNYSSQGSGRILKTAATQDLGESNNCVACHTGTAAGVTLKQIATKVGAAGSFWSATPFIDSHGMGSAGILFQNSGYTYLSVSTRNYAAPSGFIHASLDDAYYGGQGACISCHLKTDQPHLFSPISSAGNGVVSKITAFDQVCSECHDGGVHPADFSTPAKLDAKKQGFVSSLKALSAALSTKGIYFNAKSAPYFFNVSDPAQQGPVGSYYTNWNALYDTNSKVYAGSDLMGAAFNLRLLWSDRGAYTHNDYYAKRLIYDSLDYVDNGTLDTTNPVFTIIQNLPVSAAFTADDKARAQSYLLNPATGTRW